MSGDRAPSNTRLPTTGLWTIVLLAAYVVFPAEAFQKKSDQMFAAPDLADVRTEVMNAVARLGLKDETALDRIAVLWAKSTKDAPPADTLELVVRTFAAVHPETSRFVDRCQFTTAAPPVRIPQPDNAPAAYSANLSLYHGRHLAQRRLYDEALGVLQKIDPRETVEPAALFFFRAVCEHQLLQKDAGLRSLDQLLRQTVGVPIRYRQVGELMKYELENLKPKSLDEISRLMGDVGRRLDLGRGGERVQKKEADILARLDELIKKMEDQQGGGAAGQPRQGGSQNSPADAAPDSVIKGGKADGDVDKKRLANKGGWGMMDKKAETKARESIKRRFPSHYSEAIKRYNIKLAK